jgi:DNA-binding MarR family transcriptional regulator
VARCGVEEDRRAVAVRLTEAGVELTARAIAVHARAVHEALTSRFTEEEQASLLRVLSKVGWDRNAGTATDEIGAVGPD